jgi:cobalt-zinc-cadmium resistance protein CzcA
MSEKEFIAAENELRIYELDIEIDTTSVNKSPLLNYFKQQIELQSDNVSVKYYELLPKISLSYAKQKIEGVSGFFSYEAGISFPLWFFAQQGRIQEAEYKKEISKWEYLENKVSLKTEINNRLEKHERISSLLDYYKNQALPLAEEQFDFAEKSFSEGEIDYIEYIQNISQSIDIQFAYRELINQHNQSVIELKYLTGNFN